jgi:hypothetical protein
MPELLPFADARCDGIVANVLARLAETGPVRPQDRNLSKE